MDVRCILLFLAVLFASPEFAQQPSTSTGTSEAVWTWSKQCGGNHELGVTVRLERKVLYRGILPICRGSREAEDGRVEFHFSGGHRFQGEYRTRSTDSIAGDIWQAGGESDALVLGVSFDSMRHVLLNTLHVARPDKQTSSELDKGLVITTYPISVREVVHRSILGVGQGSTGMRNEVPAKRCCR
jgi:hypothetical protein